MAHVIWTNEALLDLDELTDYIARDSVHYAQSVAASILKTAKTIPEHPKIGRIVPEIERDDIRERFVYSYRLVYQVREDRIPLIAIIHGSRLLLEHIEHRVPVNE
jgi:plasmid stabilization system protein ParE